MEKRRNALVFPFTGGDPGPSNPIDSSVSASDLSGSFLQKKFGN